MTIVHTLPTPMTGEAIVDRLKDAGLRPTTQRIELGRIIWGKGDRHLTAEHLLNESREQKVKVSLATIYNTLHQFTQAGLLKEIVVEGGRSYFDTNIVPHHHFLYEDTGDLMDIPGEYMGISGVPTPPDGAEITSVEVIVRVRRTSS